MKKKINLRKVKIFSTKQASKFDLKDLKSFSYNNNKQANWIFSDSHLWLHINNDKVWKAEIVSAINIYNSIQSNFRPNIIAVCHRKTGRKSRSRSGFRLPIALAPTIELIHHWIVKSDLDINKNLVMN